MNKILIITLSNIGDAVMTTPVLEYLHKENPKYVFDIVCDKKTIEIFEHCPYLNKIYIKDKTKGFVGNINLIKALRKNFAAKGYSYDRVRDAFIPPKPFNSWVLDETTCWWEAPVAYPSDGKEYNWDEDNTQWVEGVR